MDKFDLDRDILSELGFLEEGNKMIDSPPPMDTKPLPTFDYEFNGFEGQLGNLKKAYESTKLRNQALIKENSELKKDLGEIHSLKEKINERSDQILALKKKMGEIYQQGQTYKAQLLTLETHEGRRSKQLEVKISEMEFNLKTAQNNILAAKEAIKSQEQQLAQAFEKNKIYGKQVAESHRQLEKATQEKHALVDQVFHLKNKLKEVGPLFKKRVEGVDQKYKAQFRASLQSYDSRVSELQKQIEDTEKLKRQAKEESSKLESSIEALQAKIREEKHLADKVKEGLDSKVHFLECQIDEIVEEKRKLKDKIEELVLKASGFQSEAQAAAEQKIVLNNRIDEIKKEHQVEIDGLNAELIREQDRVELLKKDLQSERETVLNLKNEIAKSEEHRQQLVHQLSESENNFVFLKSEKTAEINKLKSKLVSSQKAEEDLQQRIILINTENKVRLDSTRAELEREKISAEKAKEKINQLSEKANELQGEIEHSNKDYEQRLEEKKKEIKVFERQLKDLRGNYETVQIDLQNEKEQSQKTVEFLQGKIKTQKSEHEKLEKEKTLQLIDVKELVKTLKADLSRFQQMQVELTTKNKVLTQNYDEKTAELDRVKESHFNRLNDLNSQYENLEKTNKEMAQKENILVARNSEISKKLAEAVANIDIYQKAKKDQNSKIETLEVQISQLQKDKNSLENEVGSQKKKKKELVTVIEQQSENLTRQEKMILQLEESILNYKTQLTQQEEAVKKLDLNLNITNEELRSSNEQLAEIHKVVESLNQERNQIASELEIKRMATQENKALKRKELEYLNEIKKLTESHNKEMNLINSQLGRKAEAGQIQSQMNEQLRSEIKKLKEQLKSRDEQLVIAEEKYNSHIDNLTAEIEALNEERN